MRHPTKAAIAYASGERVRNAAALKKHLAGCEVCSDRVAFIQRFISTLETEGAGERKQEHSEQPHSEQRKLPTVQVRASMRDLTELEIQVIGRLIQGMNMSEIARQLGLPAYVVNIVKGSVFNKIDIGIRRAALKRFENSLSESELEFLHLKK
jgi:DNA-binding CsgD family transcriptional regulator